GGLADGEVVEHDHVSTGPRCSNRPRFVRDLYLNAVNEACPLSGKRDRCRDVPADKFEVIVLDERHGAQVHPVRVSSSNSHCLLLEQPDAWKGLARRGHPDLWVVVVLSRLLDKLPCHRRYPTAMRENVEKSPLDQKNRPRVTLHEKDFL